MTFHLFLDWVSSSGGAGLKAYNIDLNFGTGEPLERQLDKFVDEASPGWKPHRAPNIHPDLETALARACAKCEVGLAVNEKGVLAVALKFYHGMTPLQDVIDNLATILCHLTREAFGDSVDAEPQTFKVRRGNKSTEIETCYIIGPSELDPIPIKANQELTGDSTKPRPAKDVAAVMLASSVFPNLIIREQSLSQLPVADRHGVVALAARPLIKRELVLSAVERFEGLDLLRDIRLPISEWLPHFAIFVSAAFFGFLTAPSMAGWMTPVVSVIFLILAAAVFLHYLVRRAGATSPNAYTPSDYLSSHSWVLLLTLFLTAVVTLVSVRLVVDVYNAELLAVEAKAYSFFLFVLALIGAILLLGYGQSWAKLLARQLYERKRLHSEEKRRVGHFEQWLGRYLAASVAVVFAFGLVLYATPQVWDKQKGETKNASQETQTICKSGGGTATVSGNKKDESGGDCDTGESKQISYKDRLDQLIWSLPIVGFGFFYICWKSYSENSSASTAVHTIAHRSLRDVEQVLKRYQGFPKIILDAPRSRAPETIDLKSEAELLSSRAQRIDEARQALNSQRLQTTAAIAAGVLALLQLDPIKKFVPDEPPPSKGAKEQCGEEEAGDGEKPCIMVEPCQSCGGGSLNFRYWHNEKSVILDPSDILLPLFPSTARIDVKEEDNSQNAQSIMALFGDGIDTPAKAYAYGALSLNNISLKARREPALQLDDSGAVTDMIEHVGKALQECAGGEELKVQVVGFASDSPFCTSVRKDSDDEKVNAKCEGNNRGEPYKRKNSDELNHALAEGRRAAVLAALDFKQEHDSVRSGHLVLFDANDKHASRMPRILSRATVNELKRFVDEMRSTPVFDNESSTGFHFKNASALQKFEKPPAGEILPRSVLIRVLSKDGRCLGAAK